MRRPVIAVLVLAVVARLAFFAATDFQTQTALDPLDYERHAESIARGDGYPSTIVADEGPSALRPPAYPYALGALYALTGQDREAARLIQLLLAGLATVALLGAIARRLAGDRAALATMALAAVYPPLLAFQATLLSEALAVPLLLALVLATLRLREARSARGLVAVGVLAGLLVLTRTNAAVLLPVVALAARPGWRAPVAVLAIAALTLVPWVVRNAAVLDTPTLTTQTGYTLAGAYNDVARGNPDEAGAWIDPTAFAGHLGAGYDAILARTGVDEAELDRELRAEALAYIGDHPGYVPRVLLHNLRRSFGLAGPSWDRLADPAAGIAPRVATLCWIAFVLVALLAIAGATARRVPLALYAGAALLALSFAITQGEPRFRLLLDPLLLLLAGIALTRGPRRSARTAR